MDGKTTGSSQKEVYGVMDNSGLIRAVTLEKKKADDYATRIREKYSEPRFKLINHNNQLGLFFCSKCDEGVIVEFYHSDFEIEENHKFILMKHIVPVIKGEIEIRDLKPIPILI